MLALVEAKSLSSFSKCSQQSEGYHFIAIASTGRFLWQFQTIEAFSLTKLFGLGRSVDMSGDAWTWTGLFHAACVPHLPRLDVRAAMCGDIVYSR